MLVQKETAQLREAKQIRRGLCIAWLEGWSQIRKAQLC